jgi:hypothetical protein
VPIRGIGESTEETRWIASFRYIDDIPAERARQRFTLSYRFTERLQAGLEWNPLDSDWGPIGNFTALPETERRPAFIVGTSSDRIGTDRGQAYYGTLSKSLAPWTGLPLAPYVGTTFRDSEDDWELVGGLHYALFERRLLVTHIWDGENLHLTVDVPWRRGLIGLVLAQQEDPDPNEGKDYYLGFSVGVRLPGRGSGEIAELD